MEIVSVLAAAAAGWIFGAVWYSAMSVPWMAAAGLTDETINRKNVPAFIGSFACAVLVAGMMRHIFATSSVDGLWEGAVNGFGLGLFIATPWIATNYLFAQRPINLIFIDGIYATVGCTLMGIVLVML